MPARTLRYQSLSLILALFVLYAEGCSYLSAKPPGDVLGSCSGTVRLENGREKSFRFDLIGYEGDFRLYLTIPGMYRYRPVEDIDFAEGSLSMRVTSPQHDFEGELVGDRLTVSGSFRGYSGILEIPLDADHR